MGNQGSVLDRVAAKYSWYYCTQAGQTDERVSLILELLSSLFRSLVKFPPYPTPNFMFVSITFSGDGINIPGEEQREEEPSLIL